MHRLFVEKSAPFASDSAHLIADLRANLAIDSIESARIVQRYDLDGLSADEFTKASQLILSEPQVETSSTTLSLSAEEISFAIEFLPGQFDQRADSAAQCVQILTGKDRPFVSSARIIILKGSLTADDLAAIKKYLINPVDSHEVSVTDDFKRTDSPEPADVAILTGFNTKSEADFDAYRSELGLAMSTADLVHTQKYFLSEDREPTITELRMLDTYWSDHCRHTTFESRITKVTFDEGTDVIEDTYKTYLKTRDEVYGPDTDRPVSLMDIALMGMKELRKTGELDNVEVSNEINAASIVVKVPVAEALSLCGTAPDDRPATEAKTEEWLVQFKNETHNHPTEIEPFGGAATCLGGCIRDPLSGRSYVYQAMRVTGAADPRTPYSETIPGKLPQRKICQESAHGYSSYGNQIGLATGKVSEVYHPNYVAKRMEIGAVVSASPRKNVFRGGPDTGDFILLIGGRTGRDGVGGATGSSKEHTDDALDNSAEVQKGDAPTERKIQRLFRNPELAPKIKICNDFGAGGVSVAIGEIAESLDLDLDAVPKKYDGLDGTELAISESQERMAICVDPADAPYFIAESDKENLECVHVATVTDTGRLRMSWRGKTIVDLSRKFLDTNGVKQDASVHVSSCDALTSPLQSTHENSQKFLSQRLAPGSISEGLGDHCRTIASILDRVHRASAESSIAEPQSRAERQELNRALRSIEERELRSGLGALDFGSEKFDQLWESQGKIAGAEQRVILAEDGTSVLKANTGSYHGHWLQFLERLSLHALLFEETAYTVEGVILEALSVSILIKQRFIRAAKADDGSSLGASREQVEADMFQRFGAFRFRNDDYYIPKLDVFVEDLHNENVFLAPNGRTILYVDPVIYRRPSDHVIPKPTAQHLSEALGDLNIASQKGLGERFDSSVGAGTVLAPFGGKLQRTPVDAMVATLPFLDGHSTVCTHMSWGFNPNIATWSPYHGAAYAVTESVCRAVASGARLSDIRLTLQEYFPKLGSDPARWGLPFAALLGAFKAQHELRLGAIGGKDSMSGTFNDIDVPPTLVSFAVAPGSTTHVVSPEFKKADSVISFIEIPRDENDLPDFAKLKEVADLLHAEQPLAIHTLDHGGIATGLSKMAFGNNLGAVIDTDLDIYQERFICFLVESKNTLPFATVIGRTQTEPALRIGELTLALDQLHETWSEPLADIYPETADPSTDEAETFSFPSVLTKGPSQEAKPKVIIPAFPGTNSEYDSAKAFNEAGADASIQVFRNLTPSAVEESLAALAASIRESQILMIPGGFSAGDEPAGSGKFIATILRNPQVADAVMDLLKNRDGLILGICNGFQALVKTGLATEGEIGDPKSGAPTLTYNDIGRHIARYATTRISSNLSPWLSGTAIDDLHNVPFSHGEGKFYATEEDAQRLAAAGQIATQYTDFDGVPTMDPAFNPNGSIHAIEGITSPCGRVLGKMGHTERRGPNVGQNIAGNLHQPLFKAGVAYFA